MGMILKSPSPGVKNAEKPREIGPDKSLVFRQYFQRLGRGLEKRAIRERLIRADYRPDLLGNGEGNHEMMTRDLPVQLFFQPRLGLVMLTQGAMPVSTGPGYIVTLPTLYTPVDSGSQPTGPTIDDSVDHFSMARGYVGISLDVFRRELMNYLVNRFHFSTPS